MICELDEATVQRASVDPMEHELPSAGRRADRWMFLGLCVYLLSQSFNVPVLAIGPSWTLWPALPDFAITLLALVWLAGSSGLGIRPTLTRRLLVALVIAGILSAASYAVLTVLPRFTTHAEESAGVSWGAYGLIRLAQVIVVFAAISQISLDAWRCKVLEWVVSFVHLLVSASIIATFFSVVTTADLTRHLPTDIDVAGAWHLFHRNFEGDGLGGQGYNHGYVACQVILLFMLRLQLCDSRCGLGDLFFLLLTLVAVFLTRSRAGFACMAVLAVIYLARYALQNPLTLLSTAVVVPLGFFVAGAALFEEDVFERQVTAFQFYERENLSGRDDIWAARIEVMNRDMYIWFVGRGFGTGVDYGEEGGMHSHNLILHVISETGIAGLLVTAWLWCLIMSLLWSLRAKALFWGSGTLLLFAMTYEVFYPIPAMQHFLAFYTAAVAIGLRREADGAANENDPADTAVTGGLA